MLVNCKKIVINFVLTNYFNNFKSLLDGELPLIPLS